MLPQHFWLDSKLDSYFRLKFRILLFFGVLAQHASRKKFSMSFGNAFLATWDWSVKLAAFAFNHFPFFLCTRMFYAFLVCFFGVVARCLTLFSKQTCKLKAEYSKFSSFHIHLAQLIFSCSALWAPASFRTFDLPGYVFSLRTHYNSLRPFRSLHQPFWVPLVSSFERSGF